MAAAAAARQYFDMAFVDIRLGNESGLDLIPELLASNPGMKIVVITAYASIDSAVEAIKRGAQDYLPKPFTPTQIGLIDAQGPGVAGAGTETGLGAGCAGARPGPSSIYRRVRPLCNARCPWPGKSPQARRHY